MIPGDPQMRVRFLSSLVVGTLATLATPIASAMPQAEFQSAASGNYSYSLGSKSGSLSIGESDNGAFVSVTGAKNGYGFNANAEAAAGQLKAYAQTEYHPYGQAGYGYSSASATASFTDFVTFLGGTGSGSASFSTLLNGSLTGGADGNAGYSLSVALYDVFPSDWDNTYYLGDSQQLAYDYRNISGRQRVTVNDLFESDFDFEYGKTYAIAAYLTVNVASGGIADFSHTASFAMAAAPGTTVASSAGINYGIPAAVPEPESYAMLLAGLGLIGLVARRRR